VQARQLLLLETFLRFPSEKSVADNLLKSQSMPGRFNLPRGSKSVLPHCDRTTVVKNSLSLKDKMILF
jgi:hypothetical protein